MKTYEEAIEYIKEHGCLPEGFDQWETKNKWGSTLAHERAIYGHLPEGFAQWHLTNGKGVTVFEEFVSYGHDLPEWFNDWDLVITDDGETCQEIYERIVKNGLQENDRLYRKRWERSPWD